MDADKKTYRKYVEATSKKSQILLNTAKAFLFGGIICCLGEALGALFGKLGAKADDVKLLVPVSLIFLSVLLTGLGWYDKIAKHAGAGAFVPITGFANAVSAPAIDSKPEGLVLGVGAKMFIIAGPVIVYGIAASALYGLVYYIFK